MSSPYRAISSQTSLVFQPPQLLKLHGFLCKKTTAPISSYFSVGNVLLRRITVYQGDSCSAKLKSFDPLMEKNHQRKEVLNTLHNVVSNMWTFDPAFIENTAQNMFLLLRYRTLNRIQFFSLLTYRVINVKHTFYSKSLIYAILKCWKENQEYQEEFSSLSSIPSIHYQLFAYWDEKTSLISKRTLHLFTG